MIENADEDQRWPNFVFKPPTAHPKVMVCPLDVEPMEGHSYVLNDHLASRVPPVLYSSRITGFPSSDIVVMGEKYETEGDYYMNDDATHDDFIRVVSLYKHGARLGSNYLFLDMHAGVMNGDDVVPGLKLNDPWDVPK
jgi:hypothetical protein